MDPWGTPAINSAKLETNFHVHEGVHLTLPPHFLSIWGRFQNKMKET